MERRPEITPADRIAVNRTRLSKELAIIEFKRAAGSPHRADLIDSGAVTEDDLKGKISVHRKKARDYMERIRDHIEQARENLSSEPGTKEAL